MRDEREGEKKVFYLLIVCCLMTLEEGRDTRRHTHTDGDRHTNKPEIIEMRLIVCIAVVEDC